MTITEHIAAVRREMAEAARESGRSERDIFLVGASKMNDAAACREAIAAGIDALGENRVQEMIEQTAPADIYKRWCQFGLLSSHSRLHGSSSYRVPWLFDEESCVILKECVNLKCRLMPYIYEQAVKAHKNGTPVLRPMMLEFSEDRACDCLDLQYMTKRLTNTMMNKF